MRLLGYSDRYGAAPGDRIGFHVSCDHPSYAVQLVRLIHGDTNPAGPGFREREVPSAIDGIYPGRRQEIHSGSHIEVPASRAHATANSFTFTAFIRPTMPDSGPQAVASRWAVAEGGSSGWAVVVGPDLELWIGDGSGEGHVFRTEIPLRDDWFFVAASYDWATGAVTLWQEPVRPWPRDASRVRASSGTQARLDSEPVAPLLMAALPGRDGPQWHFNGRIDRPRLFRRALSEPQLERVRADADDLTVFKELLVGAWDFSADIATERVRDVSGKGNHGQTVNMPTRAVTGHNFTGQETSFRLAPREYGAIHFHSDDLEDAGWEESFALEIPAELPSGVYAARLRAGDDEDHLPFFVRPPRGTTTSRIAVLASTMTYLTYSNFTDLGPWTWRDAAPANFSERDRTPNADPMLFREVFQYIDENALYGLYDRHLDGSGVVYGSMLKPNLTMRPKFRYRVWSAPPRFPADLYLVDWLEAKGIAVDYLTDHDLHAEGADLLRPYKVIVSSSHHEYWTAPMLDALEEYLGDGGRFMYLGGNGLFGVLSVPPDKPHAIELRRWGTGWPFELPPAERYHSTTGEPGGTWRNRGRAPNRIVGVGTCAAGFDRGVPYQRTAASRDPRVAFIFEGLEDRDLIGDIPSLQVKWGAGGYEVDRYEPELGSPATAIILATTIGLSELYETLPDEILQFTNPRDGYTPTSPPQEGEIHPFVHADMLYIPYPAGGGVFTTGSICWRGCLSYNRYDNDVSRMTENVLRRFAADEPLPA